MSCTMLSVASPFSWMLLRFATSSETDRFALSRSCLAASPSLLCSSTAWRIAMSSCSKSTQDEQRQQPNLVHLDCKTVAGRLYRRERELVGEVLVEHGGDVKAGALKGIC
eukprot:761665-Hanusia_phi.AAC.5